MRTAEVGVGGSGGATPRTRRPPGRVELVGILAFTMSLPALGVDLLLPAFGDIRSSLSLPADSTAVSGLITAYFVGLAVGQLVAGPVADRFGRRPVLYGGLAAYAAAAVATALAPTLELLLVTRLLWGTAAGAPRIVTVAMVRDRFEGEQMSRVMSLIMAVFILVPVITPSLGAGFLLVAPWRLLLLAPAVAAAGVAGWAVRLEETLHPEHRLPLRWSRIGRAAREVVTTRQTVGYMLAMTSLYGSFTSYLGSSELIISDVFGQPTAFPVIFGALASVMGMAMVVNARIVERVGTRRLAHTMQLVGIAVAAVLVVATAVSGGRPPDVVALVCVAGLLASQGLLIPNYNAIAMQPMGAVAGTASSVIGAVQIAVGAAVGAVIDASFDGTALPLSIGFLGCGLVALGFVLWAEHGRLFQALPPPAPAEELTAATPQT